MNRRILAATATPALAHLATTPAVAATGGPATGIVSLGPGSVLIAIALGIVLTLIGRPLISSVSRSAERGLRRRQLLQTLRAAGTESLHDFILPGTSGGLVPIGHAVLVPGGVVCVQVKHYNGTVFTNDGATQWNVVDGSERHRFMNPVMQNESRTEAIRAAVPELPVAGLVVFAGAVEFPEQKPDGVVLLAELAGALDAVEFDGAAVDAVDDWEASWLRLKAAALTDDESRKDLDAQVSFG